MWPACGGGLGTEPSACRPLTHGLLLRRLAPMRLYTLSKRHFVLVFVVFFICFGLTVFVGIRGKVQFLIILSFTVTLVQHFSARPSHTHLLSPVKGPVVEGEAPLLSEPTGWRGPLGPAPHSS